jgi:broad specificity phosphatase PhoE
MQSGQYHSAGEVLATFYSILYPHMTSKEDDEVLNNFKKLLISFRHNPELFFPMEQETREAFRRKAPAIVKKLQKLHMENVRKRIASQYPS